MKPFAKVSPSIINLLKNNGYSTDGIDFVTEIAWEVFKWYDHNPSHQSIEFFVNEFIKESYNKILKKQYGNTLILFDGGIYRINTYQLG